MTSFDVAIVGLGAMGSAAALALSRAKARIVAFDRLAPPHTMGSSHGHTRIIREAYYEHPLYVPLVRRAYELWRQLEADAGVELLRTTGGLMVGREDGPLVRGALASATTQGIAHELLDAATLNRRFPAYHANRNTVGLLEERAGLLFPERCIQAQLDGAAHDGALLHMNEAVVHWTSSASGVTIRTSADTYRADRLIVAAGAWLPGFADSVGIALPLEIERQLSHWFEPEDPGAAKYMLDCCPVALWEMPDGDVFATLPNEGHGVKCGMHHAGAPTSPETVSRTVTQGENAVARELLETVMPGAGGRLLESRVCLYTNTPDRHFLIDWLPGNRVLVVSPCSGHGFKFASAIGEIAAQLVTEGRSWLDLSPFALRRFASVKV
jgi:sarcosine oxidase